MKDFLKTLKLDQVKEKRMKMTVQDWYTHNQGEFVKLKVMMVFNLHRYLFSAILLWVMSNHVYYDLILVTDITVTDIMRFNVFYHIMDRNSRNDPIFGYVRNLCVTIFSPNFEYWLIFCQHSDGNWHYVLKKTHASWGRSAIHSDITGTNIKK